MLKYNTDRFCSPCLCQTSFKNLFRINTARLSLLRICCSHFSHLCFNHRLNETVLITRYNDIFWRKESLAGEGFKTLTRFWRKKLCSFLMLTWRIFQNLQGTHYRNMITWRRTRNCYYTCLRCKTSVVIQWSVEGCGTWTNFINLPSSTMVPRSCKTGFLSFYNSPTRESPNETLDHLWQKTKTWLKLNQFPPAFLWYCLIVDLS